MKRLAILALFLLVACKPQIQYVPVPCPEPPQIQRPVLPITTLKPEDSMEKERQLWLATVQALDSYCKQLEDILSGYRSKK